MFSDFIKECLFEKRWLDVTRLGVYAGDIRPLREYSKDRLFGIEIELEGSDFAGGVPGWTGHAEGSLRGEAIEYVTTGPVALDDVLPRMETLNKALKESGTRVDKTYRASTHIHYNVQHKTLDHILKSIIVFMCYEPLICELCGPERNGNLFCLPTYDCGDMVLWLGDLLKKLSGPARQSVPFERLQRGKYSALNTDPLTRFGTLECRVFPSTVSKEDIFRWCGWLNEILGPEIGDIVDYVKGLEISAFNPGGEIQRIFKDDVLPMHARSLIGFGTEQAWPLAILYERAMK